MSTLTLPSSTKPHNLRLAPSATAKMIDGDMYNICERIRELDESLFIVELEHSATETHAFAIMEDCADGTQRLVFKVNELDGRVVDKLRRIMAIPFAERLAQCERECYEFEAEEARKSEEDMFERVGMPMLGELERCGFIKRPRSYAKSGPTGGRGSLRREGRRTR